MASPASSAVLVGLEFCGVSNPTPASASPSLTAVAAAPAALAPARGFTAAPRINCSGIATACTLDVDMGEVHGGVRDSLNPSKAEDMGNEVEPFSEEADGAVNLKFGELWMALEEGKLLGGGGRVQLASTALDSNVGMFKTEVSYTYGIENLLEQLQGPLAIVHTVHPREVEENFEKWKT